MPKSIYESCLYFDVNTMSSALLSFKLQHILVHPLPFFRDTQFNTCYTIPLIIVGMIQCHIQLCVICIGMVRQSMPLNDITNRFGVHAINIWTQNRTLWNSKAEILIYGYRVFNNYTLYPTDCIASHTVNIT